MEARKKIHFEESAYKQAQVFIRVVITGFHVEVK